MPAHKILAIDGNSLIHRAYYALPELSTSQGTASGAVLGFTNMLFKVLDQIQPDFVVVAMDKGKITFRHDKYDAYKAGRKKTPPDLVPQFAIVREVLAAMCIPVIEMEGFEADDLIGTVAARAQAADVPCMILTGDRDVLQLVSETNKVIMTRKGISETVVYDGEKVLEQYGVTPCQYVELRALTGDASDNIPGVPGIGEKTAVKLISAYGTLEGILAHLEELPARTKQLLEQYSPQAFLSRELSTIIQSVPLDFAPEECSWPGPDYQALLRVFQKLEFKRLISQVLSKVEQMTAGISENPPATGPSPCPGISEAQDPALVLEEIYREGSVALAAAGSRAKGICSLALATGQKVFLFPGTAQEPNLHTGALLAGIARKNVQLYLHHAKDFFRLLQGHGIPLPQFPPAFDTMLAAYLLNPAMSMRSIEQVALEHLNLVIPEGEGNLKLARAARTIYDLVPVLSARLENDGLISLFEQIELPLVNVLADMEITGVAVDVFQLKAMSSELGAKIEKTAEMIYHLAGERFNINSPRQLADILFVKLKLPTGKKTKTGYSTNAEVLEELAGTSEIVRLILTYRQLVKLKSTYVDAMVMLIDPTTGCLHTTYQQALTATGRLSSIEPNLQNIPVRMEEGRKIRRVFIPRKENHLILSADYSQIELRILAHLSGDENLIASFCRNEDIHTRTASEVFGIAPDLVTKEMRGHAKEVNFGIVYGISDFGLAGSLNITRTQARRYIDNYFARYSGVREFIDQTVSAARARGYVTTLYNRRRYIPDLNSKNHTARASGERTAINTPVQGTAADIIKLAMVDIHRLLKERSFKTRMILQVHDELIFEVPVDEMEEICDLVKKSMENVAQLKVPLLVDLKAGPNWYEVKKIRECW